MKTCILNGSAQLRHRCFGNHNLFNRLAFSANQELRGCAVVVIAGDVLTGDVLAGQIQFVHQVLIAQKIEYAIHRHWRQPITGFGFANIDQFIRR